MWQFFNKTKVDSSLKNTKSKPHPFSYYALVILCKTWILMKHISLECLTNQMDLILGDLTLYIYIYIYIYVVFMIPSPTLLPQGIHWDQFKLDIQNQAFSSLFFSWYVALRARSERTKWAVVFKFKINK